MNESKTDWGELKQKLNSMEQLLKPENTLSPEVKRSIFKERADAIRTEKVKINEAKDYLKIVEFSLASETYGIESEYVREIYPLKYFRTIPGVPSFVLGIINVRGQIVSVIDFKKFFGLPEKGIGELNKVIIIHNEQMEFGILADLIHGANSVPIDKIQTSPFSISQINAGYLKGVTDNNIIILDAEKILGDANIIVHQKED